MHLLTAADIPRLRQQYADGNPYVGYPVWYNNNWPQNVDPVYGPTGIFVLWAITGEQKWMDLLTEKFHVPTFRLDGNTWRECCLYWVSMYKLLTPYWSPDRLLVLEHELKQMATESIRYSRAWDADERRILLLQCAMMDEQFGTSYMTASERVDTASPYYTAASTIPENLAMQQEDWAREGIDGLSAESAGYTVNTEKLDLYGVACLRDRSILPGLDEWVRKYRDFVLWSVSSDYKQAINYGDAEGGLDQAWEMAAWYRLPMLWLLSGIGLDEDGAIADLAVGIAEARAGGRITNPGQLHPILNWGAYLVTDFSLLPLDGPRKPLPTGVKVFRNFGAIYRDENLYYYAIIRPWLHDDHDYWKGEVDYRLYDGRTGECPINRPGEYAQDWTFYNAAAIKGMAAFNDRGFDSAEFTDGKLIVKAHHRGPMPGYYGKPFDLPSEDYIGHEFLTTLEFTPANVGTDQSCHRARFDWKHDGVFPDPSWNQYMRDFRAFRPFESQQFIGGGLIQLDESSKTIRWNTPKGQEMLAAYDGSEEVGLTSWVFGGYEYFKRFRMYSDRHEGFHEIVTTAGVLGAVPPPPPLPPPPDPIHNVPAPDDQLPAPAALTIVDNTSVGYHVLGAWVRYPGQGVGDLVDYVEAGDGSRVAVWRAKVSPGVYNVATIWLPMLNRATDAPFAIKLGDTVIQTVIVNQELPPSSFTADGVVWHTLAAITVTADAILAVELSNAADEFVIADAVRIEKTGDVAPPPIDPPPPVDPPPPAPGFPLGYGPGTTKVLVYEDRVEILQVIPK